MINLIAVLVAIAGILAVAGNGAYLALFSSAAKSRGAAGGPASAYVSKQWKPVGIMGAAAVVGLLLTTGGTFADILAILVAGGTGVMAVGHLGKLRQQLGKPELGS